MHSSQICGRRYRTFNVVDEFNREALSNEIDLNLEEFVYPTGSQPAGDGPEFFILILTGWAEKHAEKLEFIMTANQRRILSLSVLTGRTVHKYSIFFC
ncbi:putative transposase [Grimontella sp. AG753]|nr:putative transposase [Grimontella sp. AG753]